jgi:hypothetical protein
MEVVKELRVKIAFLIIVFVFSYNYSFSQTEKMRQIFDSGLKDETFYHFVLKDLSDYNNLDECKIAFSTFIMTIQNGKVDSTLILGNLPKELSNKIDKRIKETDGMWKLHLLDADKSCNVVLHVFLVYTKNCDERTKSFGETLSLIQFSERTILENYDNFLLSDNYIMAVPIVIDDSIKR